MRTSTHRTDPSRTACVHMWIAPLIVFVLLAGTPPEPAPNDLQLTPQLRKIDEGRAAALGIRKIPGKYLTLYTDLDAAAEVDELPQVFEQAVSEWSAYFGVADAKLSGWHVRGFLMKDKSLFQRAGLMPDELPPFQHGYLRDRELWLYEQPSAYYRRHLLLHEGTHGFMFSMLGSCGPPWYMEGMAELMATHFYRTGKLDLRYFPARRDDVPLLGRIKLVQQAAAAHQRKSLDEIMTYDNRAHMENEPYAWCWAVAAFLDGHPAYRERFRRLPGDVRRDDFNDHFRAAYRTDWNQMMDEFTLFADTLVHGHDIPRTAISFQRGELLVKGEKELRVAADRGWQNTGLWLDAGRTYQLIASGRFQVASRPKIWWCEAGGVTIRYHRGRPLGMLLGTLWRPDRPADSTMPFVAPFAIGTGTTLRPEESGTLYLAINDSPGELNDNAGALDVMIRVE